MKPKQFKEANITFNTPLTPSFLATKKSEVLSSEKES